MWFVKVFLVVFTITSASTDKCESFKSEVNRRLTNAAYNLLGLTSAGVSQPRLSRLHVVENLVQKQMEEIKNLKKIIRKGHNANKGAVYVRWGRHDCPENGTEFVYKGSVGGSWPTHTGGSVSYECLPEDPTWDKYDNVIKNDNQNMHGAEYSIQTVNIAGTALDQSLNGHDVPCVVCRSTERNSVLRIPARNRCYDGWHLEYAGYLMSGKYTDRAASEYLCIDKHPSKLHGGKHAKGGKKITPVEGHCGYSLRCPPYVHGRELTCVVCTK